MTRPAPVTRPAPLPSRADPTAWRAARALGGAWGRHAGVARYSWWTPLRWLMALTLATLVLGFVQKSPCANGDWTGNKQYTHFCYSDVVPLWSDERLDVGAVPYRDTSVEYPVLTGAVMFVTADLTRGVHALTSSANELVTFGALTALILAACGLVVTAATAQAQRRRPWDAAIFALSPLLVFHAFSNWDLLAMAFTSAAMWAWAARRPVLAGAMIGLGTAAKLYPVFLLVAIGILAIRTRKLGEAAWTTAATLGVWLAVNLPIAIAYRHGWATFYTFSIDRPTERSTLWAIGRTLAVSSFNDSDAPYWQPPSVAVAIALLAALLFVGYLGLAAPIRPRLAQLAFLCVLAFLLTTKVWSPQYSLWLVPLLALARPRWRLNLIWQFSEIAVWMLTLTLLLGVSVPPHGVAYGWLALALLVRDGLLLALAGLVVREMWHPELDVVRLDGVDDPGGGVFDGAPDALGGWSAASGGSAGSRWAATQVGPEVQVSADRR
ncbi:glycosyltransferase family 87 protein [uncultured Jatrophihabitans sp.]|uniref:glycosyltransferase family 87 protein n=1 Tax=uncultured Jatrophihabitans sp. TaxID=1610747 RepID=UPI0035CB6F91